MRGAGQKICYKILLIKGHIFQIKLNKNIKEFFVSASVCPFTTIQIRRKKL
jgi:hypothetical protein